MCKVYNIRIDGTSQMLLFIPICEFLHLYIFPLPHSLIKNLSVIPFDTTKSTTYTLQCLQITLILYNNFFIIKILDPVYNFKFFSALTNPKLTLTGSRHEIRGWWRLSLGFCHAVLAVQHFIRWRRSLFYAICGLFRFDRLLYCGFYCC